MASTKLTSVQHDLRSKLLEHYATRAASPERVVPESVAELGLSAAPRSQRKRTGHPKVLVLFQRSAKVVTPDEKTRFYAAACDPKNKDRKKFPIVEIF